MSTTGATKAHQWVASLYFFQSLPFVVVSLIAALMYQNYGMDNSRSVLLISLLMLPWAFKPFFAPILEQFSSKKRLTVLAQASVAIIFFMLALLVGQSYFILISFIAFACLALLSSLHDIVSDGVYLQALDESGQKRYIALRTLFYQFGRLIVKGALLVFIGRMSLYFNFNPWQVFFFSLFAIALLLAIYHYFKLPETKAVKSPENTGYGQVFKYLLSHRSLLPSLVFIFLYNAADAQMQKIIPLYLLDKSGLNLGLGQVGEIYGLMGSCALMLGVFISGFLLNRCSLKHCLRALTLVLFVGPVMFLFINGGSLLLIALAVIMTQLTVGMANGAFMGYMLRVANKTLYPMSAYTLCTAIMALSYVFFGGLSGFVEQSLGYFNFFLYILLANILVLMITFWVVRRDE